MLASFIVLALLQPDSALEKLLRLDVPVERRVTGELALRVREIREVAFSRAVAIGYNAFIEEAAAVNRKAAPQLERIFDFGRVVEVFEENTIVLPPVVALTGVEQKISDDGQSLDVVGDGFVVMKPARIVLNPPTWRDYLALEAQPELPVTDVLLPRNDEEKQVWDEAIYAGYQKGREVGENALRKQIDTLVADFEGIILYRSLLARGMLTKFYVATEFKSIETRQNSITIGGRIAQITVAPGFVDDVKKWKPVIVRPEPSWGQGND